jgi:hypothetical protein
MWWLVSIVFMGLFALSAIRKAEQTGQWRWSRFALSLGFAVFEGFLIVAPLFLLDTNAPYFLWVAIATWVLAAALMVWFAIWARRWKPGSGRTPLKADGEQRQR